MKSQEAHQQRLRLDEYNRLVKLRDELYAAQTQITSALVPKGLFTGNTRKLRYVKSIAITITATQSGDDPAEMEVHNLHIPAWVLGRLLEELIQEQLDTVFKEINAI